MRLEEKPGQRRTDGQGAVFHAFAGHGDLAADAVSPDSADDLRRDRAALCAQGWTGKASHNILIARNNFTILYIDGIFDYCNNYLFIYFAMLPFLTILSFVGAVFFNDAEGGNDVFFKAETFFRVLVGLDIDVRSVASA